MSEKNQVPVEDQAPSEAARQRIDEQALAFREAVHAGAPASDFEQGEPVEIRADRKYRSLTAHADIPTKGRKGQVVGQAFVAGDESRHAGKVCRAVVLESGDMVTTPEEDLRASRGRVAGYRVSQERWDEIFSKE